MNETGNSVQRPDYATVGNRIRLADEPPLIVDAPFPKIAPVDQFDPLGRFTGLPIRCDTYDGRSYILARDVSYRLQSGVLKGRVSTIHEGFVFDWASVPRIFWNLIPPAGLHGEPYGIASLWHDWAYQHHAIEGIRCSRSQADDLFLEIMLYVGVSTILAHTIWGAVRVGGWWAWDHQPTQPVVPPPIDPHDPPTQCMPEPA